MKISPIPGFRCLADVAAFRRYLTSEVLAETAHA